MFGVVLSMVLVLKYIPRDELIDIITRNNMVEEFTLWVKRVKGDTDEPISLRDIDYELLLRFVVEKKLIEIDDQPEYLREVELEKSLEAEFTDIEKQALPRKVRRKT